MSGRRALRLFSAALVCALCPTGVGAGEPAKFAGEMFPPEFSTLDGRWGGLAGFDASLVRMGEAPIWKKGANGDDAEIIRLFLQQTAGSQFVVTLRRSADGSARVVTKTSAYGPKVKQPAAVMTRSFPVDAAELQQLDAMIAKAALWKFYPGAWPLDPDSICIDGIYMIMERASSEGHGFVHGNILCEVGRDGVAVVNQLLSIGHVENIGGIYVEKI